ncbi:hypothetical protein [Microbacterium sp. A93]|uniref:hypothetical protein n=1 Tax=Microbacterium sp. A93 TaxID=3450716 RepID=UPI003F42C6E0
MSRLFLSGLRDRESTDEVAALSFAENMRVDLEDRAGIGPEVLRHFMYRRSEAQPSRRGVVAQRMAAKAKREFANDADLQLSTLLVGEQICVALLVGRVL